MLDITLMYNDLDELPNVPTSNVEEFAISLEQLEIGLRFMRTSALSD